MNIQDFEDLNVQAAKRELYRLGTGLRFDFFWGGGDEWEKEEGDFVKPVQTQILLCKYQNSLKNVTGRLSY